MCAPPERATRDHDPHPALSCQNPHARVGPRLPGPLPVAAGRAGRSLLGAGPVGGKERAACRVGGQGGGLAMVERAWARVRQRRAKATPPLVARPRAARLLKVAASRAGERGNREHPPGHPQEAAVGFGEVGGKSRAKVRVGKHPAPPRAAQKRLLTPFSSPPTVSSADHRICGPRPFPPLPRPVISFGNAIASRT